LSESAADTGIPVLPWQRAPWRRLIRAHRAGRLPHALLVTGLAGLGKTRFARSLARYLLCTGHDHGEAPCGRCRGCHLFEVGSHPDFRLVEPAADSKSGDIKIEAVRELVAAEGLSAQAGGYKVVIIDPGDALNRSAANGLLKTLEEPTPLTLMLLPSAYPGRLPATVRSRCQAVQLAVPPEAEALAWLRERRGEGDAQLALRLANGAPLGALSLLEGDLMGRRSEALDAFLALGEGRGNPVATAESWMKLDLPVLFDWIGGWVADMARIATRHPAPRLVNPDRAPQLERLARRADTAALHRYWSRAAEAKLRTGANLSPQLVLEDLLLRWVEIFAGAARPRTVR
jgi:DNA polymerase-3 subunit delta'